MPVFSERNKEKIHWMLYDRNPGSTRDLDPDEVNGAGDSVGSLPQTMANGSVLEYFQDINRKTKLETNMDASGMLSRNSFEVRALRVVIAPLPEEEDGGGGGGAGAGGGGGAGGGAGAGGAGAGAGAGGAAAPADDEGLSPRVIEEFIYNSVTTLIVGEKKYIEAPTFSFPSGTGSFGGNGSSGVSHGEPNPMATFRFAEPILIPPQQSFRVEISFPNGLDEDELADLYGAWISVWVVLDGYLIRDIQ